LGKGFGSGGGVAKHRGLRIAARSLLENFSISCRYPICAAMSIGRHDDREHFFGWISPGCGGRSVAAGEQLNINYVAQNYLDFETQDRFDLVLMIMCDFCALSPVQRKGMLSKFRNILKPGGSVLLDVCSLAAFDQREEAATYQVNLLNGFWSPNKYHGFLNIFKWFNFRLS